MIALVTSPEAWAERYGLDLENKECLGCKQTFPVNEPFAIKGYRGFRMPDHGCPEKYRRTILVPWDKEEIEFWNNQFAR